MDSAQAPKGKITAQEYFAFVRNLRGRAPSYRQGDPKSMQLMQLHNAVNQERRATIKALGEAYQKNRGEFYGLKGDLQRKIDSLADPDMRAISQSVLDGASQSVIMQATYLRRVRVMHDAGLAGGAMESSR